MNSAIPFKYKQRAGLIKEAFVVYEFLGMTHNYTTFSLQADAFNPEGGDDWSGFVQTLKVFIKGENSKVNTQLTSVNTKVDDLKKDLNEIKELIKGRQ